MKIPAIINFSNIHKKQIFEENTPEYKALMALRDDGTWKDYVNEQLGLGVSVRYDSSSNVFATQPDRFINNELKENYGTQMLEDDEEVDIDDDNIDIEAGDDLLSNIMVDDEEGDELPDYSLATEPIEMEVQPPVLQPEQNNEQINNNQMQVVSLDDVMSIIQQVMGNSNSPTANPTAAMPDVSGSKDSPLQGGAEALKKVYFQGDGNEILNSDFNALGGQVDNFESHVKGVEPYVKTIGGAPSKTGAAEQPGLKNIDMNFDGTSENNCGDAIIPDNFGTVIEPQADVVDMEVSEPIPSEDPFDLGAGLGDPTRLVKDLPVSSDFDPEEEDEEEYGHDKDTELLLDTDEDEASEPVNGQDEDESSMQEADGDDFKHPDLDRITGGLDYDETPDEEFVDMPEEDFEQPYEEPKAKSITANKDINIGGQRVKLILTGVMITADELSYIGEAVKNAGNSLKQINGKGKELNIIVETADKNFTINYVDTPNNKTKTPFSIANHKFTSLEEALERINYKKSLKEAEVFEKIVGEDIFMREFGMIKESDIFDYMKEPASHVTGWNVMSVGYLNLKNGLNETFSKITQTGKEQNTLVMSNDGTYYLIKGNLKERSKIGTKKELVETKAKKSLGNVQVVGLFENTQEGLGSIMYKIKRTAIPLLVWK